MNRTWHMTGNMDDGTERYLNRDEAEAWLCQIIMDIELTEQHWGRLCSIHPSLQVAASVYHPQMSAKLWDRIPDSLKRTAIASEEQRATMVKRVVRSVMLAYAEEEMT